MTTRNLIRWSGMALLLTGALWAFGQFFHPDDYNPSALLDRLWIPTQVALGLGSLLSVLGVVGLYLHQAEKVGRLGWIGFLLALFGSALNVAVGLGLAFVIPVVAAQDSPPKPLFDYIGGPDKPFGAFGFLALIFFVTYVPGYILIAIASLRAGGSSVPRGAAWLIIIALLVFVPSGFIPALAIVKNISAGVFGIGLAWSGIAIWSERHELTQ